MVFLPEALEGVPGCTFGRPVMFLVSFGSHLGGILELFGRNFATRSSAQQVLYLALPRGTDFAL